MATREAEPVRDGRGACDPQTTQGDAGEFQGCGPRVRGAAAPGAGASAGASSRQRCVCAVALRTALVGVAGWWSIDPSPLEPLRPQSVGIGKDALEARCTPHPDQPAGMEGVQGACLEEVSTFPVPVGELVGNTQGGCRRSGQPLHHLLQARLPCGVLQVAHT